MCGSELTPKPQGLTPSDLRLQAHVSRVLANPEVPPSPCISVCLMSDDASSCVGCWRTLDEIGSWAHCSPDEKRAVWSSIGERLAARTASA
jgi:predicted Fe-S protein YdhL (DUF1289 family)